MECRMKIMTYWDLVWKCIVGQPTKLFEKALCWCLAFHCICCRMVQHVECEYRFRSPDAGWIQTSLKQLKMSLRTTRASAPSNTMLEYTRGVYHHKNALCNCLIRPRIIHLYTAIHLLHHLLLDPQVLFPAQIQSLHKCILARNSLTFIDGTRFPPMA